MHLSFYHKVHKEIHKGHKAHFVSFVVKLCVLSGYFCKTFTF